MGTLTNVGQVQDMGNRFAGFLQWLRAATPKLTRVDHLLYLGPPAYNDYLDTVPGTNLPVPYSAAPLTLPDTEAGGVVSQQYQPEVLSPGETWLLSAHGYYEGGYPGNG